MFGLEEQDMPGRSLPQRYLMQLLGKWGRMNTEDIEDEDDPIGAYLAKLTRRGGR